MIRQVVRAATVLSTVVICFFLDGSNEQSRSSKALRVTQALSFSSWFGASVWVSFVAGLIMFRNMKRNDFGRLQSKLFPAYFEYSTLMLTICCSATYAQGEKVYKQQLLPLVSALVMVLANLLYIEPKTTKIMFKRHAVEKDLNLGDDVDPSKRAPEEARNDPTLKALNKQFGMYHGISTLVNLAGLCCGAFHLYQVA